MTPSGQALKTESLSVRLAGKKALLAISGSIAAFKACDIIRQLKQCGAEVKAILTPSAEKFVTRLTLETLSGNPVLSSLWDGPLGTHHIDAARWADVAVIAPATANTVAKLALGFADDLVSTELMACFGRCPLLVAPAMNPSMYNNPAVTENLATLARRGYRILGPGDGLMACGDEGTGRMVEPEVIVEAISQAFQSPSKNKHVLLTLGPTRSAIDPVRYLSNRSSGLMGAALAWALQTKGYRVTAVCGPADAPLPTGIEVVRVQTASEMFSAARSCWTRADIFIGAAAVLDWGVKAASPEKLKKQDGAPKLDFQQSPDILAAVGQERRPGQFILGFAAETENLIPSAQLKLKSKKSDAIFVNDVSRSDTGFESGENAGYWVTAREALEIPRHSKPRLALKLVELMEGSCNA